MSKRFFYSTINIISPIMIQRKLLFIVLLLILSQSAIVFNQLNTTVSTLNSKVTNIITNVIDPIPIVIKPTLSQ